MRTRELVAEYRRLWLQYLLEPRRVARRRIAQRAHQVFKQLGSRKDRRRAA